MNIICKQWGRFAAVLGICVLSPLAQAQIQSATVSNANPRVSITSTAHSQVTWSIAEASANGGNVSVSSGSGVFLAPDNSVLGTVARVLSASRNTTSNAATIFTFNEGVTIPLVVIQQAQKKGFGGFRYVRQFSDTPDNDTRTVSAIFRISGGSLGGVLSVQRVAMSFDDGRGNIIVSPQSEISARAMLKYTGSGLLEYSWELATPGSTGGQPYFVTLISRKQYLLSGRSVVLQSPRLPTASAGQYIVRLKINRPATPFSIPVIRYTVNSSGQFHPQLSIKPLPVKGPLDGSILSENSYFEWQAVARAQAYQLEIYTRPLRDADISGINPHPPLTGMIVPAHMTRLKLGDLTRGHLNSGEDYYWRVIALNQQGRIIARSAFRRIRVP